tara:strand:- start:689 stop:1492 length:804 start_codon:yes stop_codon:yes gene_type:complete
MATLTYDPSNDPETLAAEAERDAETLEVGERMEQEQENLLAGKYKNAEDLENAYLELQKKLGSKDTPESEPEAEKANDIEEVEEEVEEADEVTATILTASKEWEESGQVSEETLAEFSNMSSQELVQAYMNLQKNAEPLGSNETAQAELSDSDVNAIENAVGGEAAYKAMTQWAGENFSQQEIAAYDQAIQSGDMNTINFALQALYYRYTDSQGFEGSTIQGRPAAAENGFRSQAEVVRAMNDPRYENDPAYRADVYGKLERSNIDF